MTQTGTALPQHMSLYPYSCERVLFEFAGIRNGQEQHWEIGEWRLPGIARFVGVFTGQKCFLYARVDKREREYTHLECALVYFIIAAP